MATLFRCDLIVRDALIFDGTGAPRRTGDVGVSGDRIIAVGDLGATSADVEIDAAGRAIAPGFIDAHTHDDRALLCGPDCLHCKLSQGVTTVVAGNCGVSLSPLTRDRRPPAPLDLLGDKTWWRYDSFADYAEDVARQGTPVNAIAFVGHTTLRTREMGDGELGRAATDAEAGRMKERLKEALAQGAWGLSTGLWYPPAIASTTEEVIAVAEALAEAGGMYVTHMRDEADGILDAIEETLTIGRAAKVPVVMSHYKCTMPQNWGRSVETLAKLDEAAARQPVWVDVYPYHASSTVLMPARLRDEVRVTVTWSVPHPEMQGRDLDAIAAEWGCTRREAAERLLPAGAIYYQMNEEDVRRIIAHPRAMIGSDGLPHDAFPHPRLWGTFPRVLGHYARELGLISMEEAVRKMTGLTAQVFGLKDRGVIRPGAYADLVLFDPATVSDGATFDDPKRPAPGIEQVWVNGECVYRWGEGPTGARPGRLLKNPRASA
ncbi:D-aminoacylase [Elioraea sp. Yellowstone]|jgi:N-acyl-D-amino-acid deacylase|uniref:N-acyl-D-amino-acid deacylase family protein n=1 Tax=Elioraea sp. Yellowstone TaxID=2592070 RepID=UPI001154A908|nr:D-aminoacylase [Elioraea sp. Yellowstone]TQF83160.1 D-aminoacylase [Elioraea sp. Yellowstone]